MNQLNQSHLRASARCLNRWPRIALRGLSVLTLSIATVGCDDPTSIAQQWTRDRPPALLHPRSNVSSLSVEYTAPGLRTMTIGIRDSATAVDSVLWPDSFPSKTRVRMTVVGQIKRRWSSTMTPAYAGIAGTAYYDLDANGEFVANSCAGDILTVFRLPNGSAGDWIRACSNSHNPPAAPTTSPRVVVGSVSGAGYVMRFSQSQPTVPGFYNCFGPCVFATSGTQQITIEPWSNALSVAANRNPVFSGDSVTFAASASGLALTVERWTWVPDSVVGSPYTPSSLGASCSTSSTTCRIPILTSGVMYVRGRVGLGTSQTVEQARVRVEARDLCVTGDSLLDLRATRYMLMDLERLSFKTVPPKEMRGYMFQDTTSGRLTWRIDSTNASNTCSSSSYTIGIPPNSRPVFGAHSHPYSLGDTICTGNSTYSYGPRLRVPSSQDWRTTFDEQVPGVIIDKTQLISYKVPTSLDSVRIYNPSTRSFEWRYRPPLNQIPSLTFTVSRGGICVLP